MHELGIAMRIVEIAANVAKYNGVTNVEAVNVEIGELTGIVPEALTFSFEAASRDTCIQNARLDLTIIPGRAKCNACNIEFAPDGFFTVCPACETTSCTIINGKELFVKSIIPGGDTI